MTQDIVHHFARFMAGLRFEDLPPAAVEAAKKSLLDTLGVSLAATGMEPAVNHALAIVEETGGAEQATLWANGMRVPAVMAAFGNGALVHALDYDDLTPWGQHVGSTIIPTVAAMAERQGQVSGKEMIVAIAAAQDIFARLLRFSGWKKDWNFSTSMGIFAGAAAGARILGLDAKGIANAIGIATLQSGGVMEMVAGQGSDLRGLYAGFSAKGAALAAILAERGLTGIEHCFEGPNGVFNCYFQGDYDRDAMLDGLGHEFMGAQTIYKFWPCVGTAHSHIKAAIDIKLENYLSVNDISLITLFVGDYHALMCHPLRERIAPKTLADAKFSLPYLVATALYKDGLSVRDFLPDAINDSAVHSIAKKMRIIPDKALDWNKDLPPGRVSITTNDGRTWTKEGQNVPGNIDNPLNWDDICKKFRECVSVSKKCMSTDLIEEKIRRAYGFENLETVTDFFQ
jgi:2-methylcitrate dehydratase PrpD